MSSSSAFRGVRRLLLAGALALATAVSIPAAAHAAAPGTATAPPAAAHSVPLNFKPIAGAPTTVDTGSTTEAAIAACPHSKAALSADYAKGLRKVGCLTRGTQSAAQQTEVTRSLAARGPANAAVTLWCDDLTAEEYWSTRTTTCINDVPLTFTLFDAETGEEIGEAALEFSDSISLNTTSAQIVETNYITMTADVDVPELLVTYSGLCDGLCAPENATAETEAPISLGTTVTGDTTYIDGVTSGNEDYPDLNNSIDMTVPGGEVLGGGYVDGSPTIRCDNGLATTTAGCVYPQVAPTVEFSLSGTGSDAAIDDWAMTNEADAWGNYAAGGIPLIRITDQTTIGNNRAAICDDGTYVPLYTDDSCEEYPFASTEQSGGFNGAVGADCAMVQAVNTSGSWSITLLNSPTGFDPCVIGHADLTSQRSQGGTLSTFYQQNRVEAGDEYWVSISS